MNLAYILIDNPKEFIGKSTDTKPTDAPVGSTFYESDTKLFYIWTPESTWSLF